MSLLFLGEMYVGGGKRRAEKVLNYSMLYDSTSVSILTLQVGRDKVSPVENLLKLDPNWSHILEEVKHV